MEPVGGAKPIAPRYMDLSHTILYLLQMIKKQQGPLGAPERSLPKGLWPTFQPIQRDSYALNELPQPHVVFA